MELVTVGLISTVVFGIVASISSFIRHKLLSHDKHLNDEAQKKALDQEARELEQLRQQMEKSKRFDSHYRILDSNVETIRYLDDKIESIMGKKLALVLRFSDLSLKESASVVSQGPCLERYSLHTTLKKEMDTELTQYNTEIESLQQRRASLWQSHQELQQHVLSLESSRSEEIDKVYVNHSSVLSKVYHRHDKVQAHIANENIKATSESYKISFLGPLRVLIDYFKSSNPPSVIDTTIFDGEKSKRESVLRLQDELNHEGNQFEEKFNLNPKLLGHQVGV